MSWANGLSWRQIQAHETTDRSSFEVRLGPDWRARRMERLGITVLRSSSLDTTPSPRQAPNSADGWG